MRAAAFVVVLLPVLVAQEPAPKPRPATLEIRNAMVIRGDGAPATGPTSVFVRDGRIVAERIAEPDLVLDGTGCTVLPGFVCTHAHLQEERGGIPIPPEYQFNLWLASGITTIRDVGSNWSRSLRMRARSERGEIAAPRIYLYKTFGQVAGEDEARERVRAFKASGADGIKLWSALGHPPEIAAAILAEAREQGLRTTAHIGVGGSDARDYAESGVTSIEHWYGIPDAALNGVQAFPPEFSYSNEIHRFRYAGRLWREVDPGKLEEVLALLVQHGVAWSPTLAIYEASRDVQRARTKPYFAEYLHPGLERFFEPSLEAHGSYFIGWTSTDEAHWAENYRIWFRALRRFAELGGTITCGEDAGFIYCMYGFCYVRELELHEEAGFKPLEVLRHATYDGARVLGIEREVGRVLPGLAADLIVVRGNPLANLKVFYPTGCDVEVDGRNERGGGVVYTIKDGRVHEAQTLLAEVRAIVRQAREGRPGAQDAPQSGK
jgi:imidazolonepropionase-like amidohydrolase